jgi:riboflavin synthase
VQGRRKVFTGIIEEVGQASRISSRLKVRADTIFNGLSIGDSVSINGVCLTVERISYPIFEVAISQETLNVTNLGYITSDEPVNLERARCLGDRLSGHLVTGHVDGTAVVTRKSRGLGGEVLEFQTNKDLGRYIVKKGSVALNGVSLTVNRCFLNTFEVCLIPYTLKHTNLSRLSVGTVVNLEVDLVAKYVEKLLTKDSEESKISLDFLKEKGLV